MSCAIGILPRNIWEAEMTKLVYQCQALEPREGKGPRRCTAQARYGLVDGKPTFCGRHADRKKKPAARGVASSGAALLSGSDLPADLKT